MRPAFFAPIPALRLLLCLWLGIRLADVADAQFWLLHLILGGGIMIGSALFLKRGRHSAKLVVLLGLQSGLLLGLANRDLGLADVSETELNGVLHAKVLELQSHADSSYSYVVSGTLRLPALPSQTCSVLVHPARGQRVSLEKGHSFWSTVRVRVPRSRQLCTDWDEAAWARAHNVRWVATMYTKGLSLDFRSSVELAAFSYIQESIRDVIRKLYMPSAAAVVQSLVIGDRGELDSDFVHLVSDAGLYILCNQSGLHVLLIAFILHSICAWIPWARVRLISEIALLVLVVCVLGNTPSVLRSAALYSTFLLLRYAQRHVARLNVLSVWGICLLIYAPEQAYTQSLVWALAAVLSYRAFSSSVNRALQMILPKRVLKWSLFIRSLAGSLSGAILLLPCMAYTLGQWHPLNLLSMLISAPLFVLTFGSIVLSLLLQCFSHSVALVPTQLASELIQWTRVLAELLSSTTVLSVASPNAWLYAAVCSLHALWIFRSPTQTVLLLRTVCSILVLSVTAQNIKMPSDTEWIARRGVEFRVERCGADALLVEERLRRVELGRAHTIGRLPPRELRQVDPSLLRYLRMFDADTLIVFEQQAVLQPYSESLERDADYSVFQINTSH